MSRVKLLVGTEKRVVDISEDSEIVLKKALRDLTNYNKRKAGFSKPFEVLNTSRTREVFKNLFNINSFGAFDVTKNVYAEIQVDSVTQIRGLLTIEDIYDDRYKVIVFEPNVNLTKIVGDKLIYGNEDSSKDVSFPAGTGQHSPTREYIRTSWGDPVVGQDFIYPLVDHDNNIADIHKSIYPVFPAINVRTLFDRIAAENGFTVEFSSDITAKLAKMYIPYNGQKEDIANTEPLIKLSLNFGPFSHLYGVDVGGTQFITTEITGGGEDSDRTAKVLNYPNPLSGPEIDIYADDYYDYLQIGDTTQFNNRPFLFTTKHSGNLKIGYHLFNGSRNRDFDNTDEEKKTKIGVVLKLPDGKLETKTIALPFDETDGSSWTAISVDEQLLVNNVPKDTEVYFYLKYYDSYDIGDSLPETGILKVSSNYMSIGFSDWQFGGSRELNDFLPRNYKQSDFLNDVINIFNGLVIPDEFDPTKLTLISNPEYFEGGSNKDITKFIDKKSILHYPTANTVKKNVLFSFNDDSDDIYLSDYKDKFDNNMGGNNILNPSEIASGTDTIKFNFASTYSRRGIKFIKGGPSTEYDIAIITDSESFKTEYEPRILFGQSYLWGTSFVWGLDTVSETQNVVTLNNGDENSSLVLNTDNRFQYAPYGVSGESVNNNTFYNKYYKVDLEKRFKDEARLLEVEAVMDKVFFRDLKFNDRLFIEGYGWFRLEEIKKYSLFTGEAKLILSKETDITDITYDSTIPSTVLTLSTENAEKVANTAVSDVSSTAGGSTNYDDRYAFKNGESDVDFQANNLGVFGKLTINHSGTNLFSTIEGPVNRDLRFDLLPNNSTDKFVFRNSDNASYNASSALLSIQANGNVGIGTTSPSDKLTIIDNTDSGYIGTFEQQNVDGYGVRIKTAGAGAASAFVVYGGQTHFFRVQKDGKIGIGTMSPTYTLDVSGTGRFSGNLISGGNITASGEVTAYSDGRLKDIIRLTPSVLESVNKLSIYDYTRNDKDDDKVRTGLIAQELQKEFPQFVIGEESEDSYLSINYAEYAATIATKGIQELYVEITLLRKELHELKSKLN